MVKTQLKTSKNDDDVGVFLSSVLEDVRRRQAIEACELMQEATGEQPVMWGKTIIGFGSYHYKYKSGREGDFFRVGLSPRKGQLTLYLLDGFVNKTDDLEKLGPHSLGKSCLYIKKWDDIDKAMLKKIVKDSYASKAMGE